MHFTKEQIAFYHKNGYAAGPRVLTDEQIKRLHARIADILEGRVKFPDHLKGETTQKSSAKGQLASVKVVNIFRHDPVFAEILKTPEIGAVAHDLMTAPVRVWEDQMIYKPAYDEKAMLAWHQVHGSYGNKTDNPRRSYILHLMPGHTRRVGNAWNPRQGNVESVPVGAIVQGPEYPELTIPATNRRTEHNYASHRS